MPDSSPAPDLRPSPWRWWVCVMLLLASTLNYMDRMALNQTAGRIKDALQINDTQYGQLESAFAIAFAIGTLSTGWLVDRVSVRWVYPAAVLGWSAFGFLTGFAPTYWILFACRFGLGVFEAGNWPCGIRTVRQVMPPAERSLGNAFFQNGTAIGAVITPFIVLMCVRWAGPDDPNAWRVPFQVIGLIGLGWVALWVFTVPSHALRSVAPDDKAPGPPPPFSAVFADRRFWLLIAVIIGVNTSWHTYRVWLPLYLREQHGYSEEDMTYFMMRYYLAADVGAWTVGYLTVWFTRRGRSLHTARVLTFAGCTALMPLCALVPHLDRGWALTVALLGYGFAALGLFPTYFALSQDLSAKHQGKVTGSLGFINAMYLAGMFAGQGWVITQLKEGATDPFGLGPHAPVLMFAGVPAVAALVLVALFWKAPKA